MLVEEPSIEDTIKILHGLKDKYEKHHDVCITDDAIVAAAKLSARYITDRFVPDKALDLIDQAAPVRIDMSEYMEKFSVSRLIGAPPGYVGYEEGGQLTEAIRRKPYSVVLFDEIEKAHPEVFHLLLQLLDDGRLTDPKGKTVDFRNTIVIMTSNLGSRFIHSLTPDISQEQLKQELERMRQAVTKELQSFFKPEFLNRIDDIIIFEPLTREQVIQSVHLLIERIQKRLAEKDITLEIEQQVYQHLAEVGFDPNYGARPLKRAIQNLIENEVALQLLKRNINTSARIKTYLKDGNIEAEIIP